MPSAFFFFCLQVSASSSRLTSFSGGLGHGVVGQINSLLSCLQILVTVFITIESKLEHMVPVCSYMQSHVNFMPAHSIYKQAMLVLIFYLHTCLRKNLLGGIRNILHSFHIATAFSVSLCSLQWKVSYFRPFQKVRCEESSQSFNVLKNVGSRGHFTIGLRERAVPAYLLPLAHVSAYGYLCKTRGHIDTAFWHQVSRNKL